MRSYEGQDVFPYNAGIMLMNMPFMRKTNKKFLNWIVSQRNGLYYPGKCQGLRSSPPLQLAHEHAFALLALDAAGTSLSKRQKLGIDP